MNPDPSETITLTVTVEDALTICAGLLRQMMATEQGEDCSRLVKQIKAEVENRAA